MRHDAHGWWIADAGVPAPLPQLFGTVHADVVVIGGGYCGLWTAWHLLESEPDSTSSCSRATAAGWGRADATAAS
jgi:ribulose 1,5-bisphosphate synthetase/thiazole synthase